MHTCIRGRENKINGTICLTKVKTVTPASCRRQDLNPFDMRWKWKFSIPINSASSFSVSQNWGREEISFCLIIKQSLNIQIAIYFGQSLYYWFSWTSNYSIRFLFLKKHFSVIWWHEMTANRYLSKIHKQKRPSTSHLLKMGGADCKNLSYLRIRSIPFCFLLRVNHSDFTECNYKK